MKKMINAATTRYLEVLPNTEDIQVARDAAYDAAVLEGAGPQEASAIVRAINAGSYMS